MAVEKKRVPLKKRKSKRLKSDSKEEVVIKIGESPKEEILEKEEVEEIEVEPEEEIEEEDDFELEDEPEEDFEIEEAEEVEVEPEEVELEEGEEEELGEEPEEEPEEEKSSKDEVVVISLGAVPEEEEKPESLEIEEEVEEEVVAVSEEEPAKAKKVKKEKKPLPEEEERKKRRKIAAIIIVFIIIVSSIGIYVFFISNQPPVARLTLNPEAASEGQTIIMDASNSSDDKKIVEYTWTFGDGVSATEAKDFADDGNFDGITEHTYLEPDDYTIELIVKDEEDKTDKLQITITITDLEVTIPEEKIGDSCEYDVFGKIEVDDDEGLWTMDSDQGTYTVTNILVNYEGDLTSETKSVSTREDGFGIDHETFERYNEENLDLSGTVTGWVTVGTSDILLPFDFTGGTLDITDSSYVDLDTEKSILSETYGEFYISAGSGIEVSSTDDLRSYSNLREESAVFRIEDLEEDRTFSKDLPGDDIHNKRFGDIVYFWEVVNATNIKGYPSLGIKVDIDSTTKSNNNIEEFDMWVWVTNGVPFPIKTYIKTIIEDDGTTIDIEYNNEIVVGEFVRGTEDIPYGECPQDTPDGHFHLFNPGYEFIDWDINDDLPDIGSSGSSLDTSSRRPQNYIDHAKTNSAGLQTYLASHSSAFVVDGYYNETQENPLWNLTFGEEGDDTGYYVIVEFDGGSYSIKDEKEISIPEVANSTQEMTPVLSYSAGELVFESDEEINDTIFDPTDNGEIMFDRLDVSYGGQAGMFYPILSITISLTMEKAKYAYYLYQVDDLGSFSAAVDAINGQLIYVWDHEGEDISSFIMP